MKLALMLAFTLPIPETLQVVILIINMKARLYIKTPWIFKQVDELEIRDNTPIIRIPIREEIKAYRDIKDNFVTSTSPIIKEVDFKFKSFDKINNEAIYVSEQ